MARYLTCRYPVKAAPSGLCLAPTVNGTHCEPHKTAAWIDAAHDDAILTEFMRRPIVAMLPVKPAEAFQARRTVPIWPVEPGEYITMDAEGRAEIRQEARP